MLGAPAAVAGDIVYMNLFAENDFLPSLDKLNEDVLARCTILYLCNPSNPHGKIASADYLAHALLLARQFNFLLVVDECYIDIWRHTCPVSALEVAMKMASVENQLCGDDPLPSDCTKLSFQRSNAAGLRAGFLCG